MGAICRLLRSRKTPGGVFTPFDGQTVSFGRLKNRLETFLHRPAGRGNPVSINATIQRNDPYGMVTVCKILRFPKKRFCTAF